MGSYTVPSETMDQSAESARGGETAQGSTKKPAPNSRSSPIGIAMVVLVLLGLLLVALRVTL